MVRTWVDIAGHHTYIDSTISDKQRNVGQNSNVTKINYITSNGLKLEAVPNKTTTVLGTYNDDTGAILNELGNIKSVEFGPRTGSFNLLNTPDELCKSADQFWLEYNKPWLDNAVKRGDIIKIVTEPTHRNMYRISKSTNKPELTGFGREFMYLKELGFLYDPNTKSMIKQEN